MKNTGTNQHTAFNTAMRQWLDAQDHTLFWGTGARTVIGTLHTHLANPAWRPVLPKHEPVLIVQFKNKAAGTFITTFFNLN